MNSGKSPYYADELLETEYQSLLFGYAAGILDEAQTLIVAAHVALSPGVRHTLSVYEQLGGCLIEQECAPVAMCDTALDSVLARLDSRPPRQRPPEGTIFGEELDLPDILAGYLRGQQRALRWQNPFPGFRMMELAMECRQSKASIIQAEPAYKTPEHTHHGLEITLVLDGGYEDEKGHYNRGDIILRNDQFRRGPMACAKHGCTGLLVYSRPVTTKENGLGKLLRQLLNR